MPLDSLPGKLLTPTRDQIRDRYLRDYRLRNPDADTGPGSAVYNDASVHADQEVLQYNNAIVIAQNVNVSTATGADLIEKARAKGTDKLPAVGAVGYVQITASAGGGFIAAGTEGKINGLRYQCVLASVYFDGDQVPVSGIDVGPETNQDAGVVMSWTTPPPGIGPTATVVLQADGSGLSGGHDVESDGELQQRLIKLNAEPPASGNDAHVQAAIARAPALSIQSPFTFPAIKGPGTCGATATLRPSKAGSNRIPNAAQLAIILAYLTGQFPADFGFLSNTLVASPVNVALKVSWASGTPGWADAVPFPTYTSPMCQVSNLLARTPTSFNLINYPVAPQPGNTIAMFDLAALKFRRKRILTATLGVGYDIVCDTTNGISDTTYTPYVGQPICPWSDSLDSLTSAIVNYFDLLGPGEQMANFFDPGLRQRRSPPSPASFPSVISNRILSDLFKAQSLQDATLQEPAVPYATPVGSQGVSSFLLTLATLVAFPQ
jgi:uncharacterized phage protein gp47/JayE